jgi:hypothetical protein
MDHSLGSVTWISRPDVGLANASASQQTSLPRVKGALHLAGEGRPTSNPDQRNSERNGCRLQTATEIATDMALDLDAHCTKLRADRRALLGESNLHVCDQTRSNCDILGGRFGHATCPQPPGGPVAPSSRDRAGGGAHARRVAPSIAKISRGIGLLWAENGAPQVSARRANEQSAEARFLKIKRFRWYRLTMTRDASHAWVRLAANRCAVCHCMSIDGPCWAAGATV